ncbi:hypothetical protein ENSA5_11700 [Enhygromyxa salina]|uniref:Uncharacterized protein n=1 Tax=Enhygromyxa salina TaxID=215803 RepID=A0A2S9YFV2_9BACT|nr:hypothetical protein ENSA5_11700 [Enhygromyxa salina]
MQAAAFSGVGLYVKVHSVVARTPLLTWLEALAKSSVEAEAGAASKQLELYRRIREAFAKAAEK